jgi:methionine-rich copper-binding protein CopC
MDMKKRRWIFLFFPFLVSTQAMAHAVVTPESLAIPALTAQQSHEIRLQFNSAIEVELSQFWLIKGDDQQEKLSHRAGKKAGEINVLIPALAAGKYALKFKVFATDSHLTEDIVYFWVK